MPSVFAVLRLITSSYSVGACTGRSAGFSPLRMLSTYVAARRRFLLCLKYVLPLLLTAHMRSDRWSARQPPLSPVLVLWRSANEHRETVNYFSVVANVRSIRSTLRSSARSSPAKPPRSFTFSKQRKLLSGRSLHVPQERLNKALLRLGLFPLPQHCNLPYQLLRCSRSRPLCVLGRQHPKARRDPRCGCLQSPPLGADQEATRRGGSQRACASDQ
jgi:hypothetical protein